MLKCRKVAIGGTANSVVSVGRASVSGAGSSSLGTSTTSTVAAAGNPAMAGSGGTQASSGASGASSVGGRPSNVGGRGSTGGTATSAGSAAVTGAPSTGGKPPAGGSNATGGQAPTGGGSSAGAAATTGGATTTSGASATPACQGTSTGTCPPADVIQATCIEHSGYNCGCYILDGLGATKKAILDTAAALPATDAAYAQQYIASAMMETERLDSNYSPGDNKTGDLLSAGAAKQTWLMMRQCHKSWENLGTEDCLMADAVNDDRALDIQVYAECRRFFGASWWAGQRNGATGLASPDTEYIHVFEAVFDWTHKMLQNDSNGNSHYCDDVRFYVDKHPF